MGSKKEKILGMEKSFVPASPLSFFCSNKYSKKYDKNIKRLKVSEINSFLSKNIPYILHCVYEDITSEKTIHKLAKNVQATLDVLKIKLPDCPIVIDSGGFQIANGKFNRHIIDEYIEIYYDTLQNISGYHKNFILDIPPNKKTFSSYSEIENLNDRSYSMAQRMNLDKGIFIFQVHNWELYKIWNRLFDKYNEGFDYFSIGGVAGGMGSDRIIMYALLFRIFIEKCIQTNRKEVNLHILGASAASPTLMLLFRLFREHVLDLYDISITITNDQSQKARLFRGCKFSTIYNGTCYTMGWFSKDIHLNFFNKTRENHILDKLNDFNSRNNINFQFDRLYDENGIPIGELHIIMCLYDIENYIKTQQIISEELDDLLDTYRLFPDSFYTKCLNFLKRLNNGKISRNLRKEAASIMKFLEILSDKDLNRVEGLLKQNSTDIFNTGILTI